MLFSEIVYGPIHSRRLGCSLGINLMPPDGKICTFNCVYCECGFNTEGHYKLPTRQQVAHAMEEKLKQLQHDGITPDVFTFSGNGEPTMHPEFEGIIDDTVMLRDRFFPMAKISVLSNSTRLGNEAVVRALKKADNRILKFDSTFNHTMRLIDQPVNDSFNVEDLMERLCSFKGDLIVQTIFLRGEHNGQIIDNTTEQEVNAWIEAVKIINPKQVMIYAIDRATPVKTLEKVSRDELETIADRLREFGYQVSVAG